MGGRALLVVSVGVTPLDIMVQWKMSCHLMEELPVAAGRSVATGAMCVNLFPCHFFCPHYPFIPPPPPSPSFSLHSLFPSPSHFTLSTSTPLWQITPGGWFVGCQKCFLRWRDPPPPPPTTPPTCLSSSPLPHLPPCPTPYHSRCWENWHSV